MKRIKNISKKFLKINQNMVIGFFSSCLFCIFTSIAEIIESIINKNIVHMVVQLLLLIICGLIVSFINSSYYNKKLLKQEQEN